MTGDGLPSTLGFSYDAASRVTNEHLGSVWNVNYGYDTAGNRTSVNDGTINRTMGYGVGNRETSVSGGISPLGYDYKGNVVSRMTLDGAKTYHYGWDAYDRLTSATQMWSGGATVNYDYDTMGRLLRRTKTDAAGTSVTINYWLGLNKIAEERIVDDADAQIFRGDSEANSNPTGNGWCIYAPNGGETMEYVADAARGNVLHLGSTAAGVFIAGDRYSYNYNPNSDTWGLGGRRQLGFWFKNTSGLSTQFNVYVRASAGKGVLTFFTGTGADYSSGSVYAFYIGNQFPNLNDGNWHYIELDLGARHYQFSGVEDAITHVDGLCFSLASASNIYIDDIIISAGALERSYGLNNLGAQTGSPGARDVNNPQAQCISSWGKYYYHWTDIHTLVATSSGNGAILGSYEPDFYGNYRNATGVRPDEIGLTIKGYDKDIAKYIYNYRMYDNERGRWSSREPRGLDGPNLYHFGFGNIINGFDHNGLNWVTDMSGAVGLGVPPRTSIRTSDPMGPQPLPTAKELKNTAGGAVGLLSAGLISFGDPCSPDYKFGQVLGGEIALIGLMYGALLFVPETAVAAGPVISLEAAVEEAAIYADIMYEELLAQGFTAAEAARIASLYFDKIMRESGWDPWSLLPL